MPESTALRHEDKQAWIRRHLRCPACFNMPLLVHENGDLNCTDCHTDYPREGRALNFLPRQLRDQFNITDTDNVSAHPYDQRCLDLIADVTARGGMALDCGSGYRSTTFPNLIQLEVAAYDNVDILGVNQALPFSDGVFDLVISLDVLEHLNDPFLAAREISRVLRPGGIVYVDVPFMQNEHGYPEHYFNMTRMGLRQVFAQAGMTVESHWVPNSGHPAYTLFSAIKAYYTSLPDKKLKRRFAKMRLEDILKASPKDWYTDPLFTTFEEDRKWIMASTTRAIVRKAGTPDA